METAAELRWNLLRFPVVRGKSYKTMSLREEWSPLSRRLEVTMARHSEARSFRAIAWFVLTLALTLLALRSADAADESTRNKIKIRKTSHLQAFKVDESE